MKSFISFKNKKIKHNKIIKSKIIGRPRFKIIKKHNGIKNKKKIVFKNISFYFICLIL